EREVYWMSAYSACVLGGKYSLFVPFVIGSVCAFLVQSHTITLATKKTPTLCECLSIYFDCQFFFSSYSFLCPFHPYLATVPHLHDKLRNFFSNFCLCSFNKLLNCC